MAVVASGLCYWPGLFGPLLLDDFGNLGRLAAASGDLGALLLAAVSNDSGPLLRPVSNLSFALNLLVSGDSVVALKATNVLLHGVAGLFAFLCARELLRLLSPALGVRRRAVAALLAAAIWLLHPMQVSTVLYVVQRMSLLASLFMLSAMFFALRSLNLRDEGTASRGPTKVLLLFFGLALLAIGSKENGALVFPLLATVLGLVWATSRVPPCRPWLLASVGPTLGGIGLLAVGWNTLTNHAGREFTLSERIVTQPFVVLDYLRGILLPAVDNLALFRDDVQLRDPANAADWAGVGVIVAALGASLQLARQLPVLALAVLWFAVCHLMESTVLPLELAFEHRNYLALFGPALAVGHGAVAIGRRFPRIQHLASGSAVAAVGLLALLTHERADRWSSDSAFAFTEVQNRPSSLRAQNFAAVVERRRGDIDGPIARVTRMKEIAPAAFLPLGMDMEIACDRPAHPVDWVAARAAAARTPANSDVLGHYNHVTLKIINQVCPGIDPEVWDTELAALANVLGKQGHRGDAQYYLVLRSALAERSRVTDARRLLVDATRLNPTNPDIWLRRVLFELGHGNIVEAKAALAELERLTPAFGPGRYRVELLRRQIADRDHPVAPMR